MQTGQNIERAPDHEPSPLAGRRTWVKLPPSARPSGAASGVLDVRRRRLGRRKLGRYALKTMQRAGRLVGLAKGACAVALTAASVALAQEGGPLVNLASGEFFKALDARSLPGRLVTPVFEDLQRGGYRVVSHYAKRARGLMVRFAVRERLQDPEQLKAFREDGYAFDPQASGPDRWVFRR